MFKRVSVITILLQTTVGWTPETPASILRAHSSLPVAAAGTSSGSVSFINLQNLTQGAIQRFVTGSLEVIDIKWNPVLPDVIAILTAENRVIVRKFDNLTSLVSTQSKLLKHLQPLLSIGWDSISGTKLLVGTAYGYVDEYTVSFVGIVGPSDTTINRSADRTRRWFLGCRVNFVYRASNILNLAGCEEGKLWFLSVAQSDPLSSITFPRSATLASPGAIYAQARGYALALFDNTIHVIDAVNMGLVTSFRIRARNGPNTPEIISAKPLSMDVSFTSNTQLDKLIVRTSDGVYIYDLYGILTGSVPIDSWVNGTSLSRLVNNLGGQIVWSAVRGGDLTNEPVVAVNSTAGSIRVTPCSNSEARYKMNDVKTDVSCSLDTPVIEVDVVMPFAIDYIDGSFDLRSRGNVSAMDCSAMKAPINEWTADQTNQWVQVMPSTRQLLNDAACPLVQDTPEYISTASVDACKAACIGSPECNMIFVRFRSDQTTVEFCTFHRCPSPENTPSPSTPLTQIWTLTSHQRAWNGDRYKPLGRYGGYVAFGTSDTVIHGGCAASNGLIPMNQSITVQIPPTNFSRNQEGVSTLRFQVSQYNAEAIVRLNNFNLNMHLNYTHYQSFYEEPASAPGGSFLADSQATGGPKGPIAWTSLGILITTHDTSIALIPN
jgi:hypothetical protein